jgi:hypothetical protein
MGLDLGSTEVSVDERTRGMYVDRVDQKDIIECICMAVIVMPWCQRLSLKFDAIATSLLLFKLEHIRTESKLPQQAIAELLELVEHFVLLLVLLSCDTAR